MLGTDEVLPRGSGVLLLGFTLLTLAGVSAIAGRNGRLAWHPLKTVHGRVSDVLSARRLHVSVDTLADSPSYARLDLTTPGLRGATERLAALPVGVTVEVDYDPMNEQVWRLTRDDGGPGYGAGEIAEWRREDQAAGRRRATWLGVAGALVIILGLVRLRRLPSDDVFPTLHDSPS